jgi:hypothetical protein
LGFDRDWSERQRAFVQLDLLSVALARWRPTGGDAAQQIVARVGILGRPGGLREDEFNVESDRYPACDFVLKSEQITGITVETLCPQMRVCLSLNELGRSARRGATYNVTVTLYAPIRSQIRSGCHGGTPHDDGKKIAQHQRSRV